MKVVEFPKKEAVPLPEPVGKEDMIACLEDLLAKVHANEVLGLCAVFTNTEGSSGGFRMGEQDFMLIGQMEYFKQRILEGI